MPESRGRSRIRVLIRGRVQGVGFRFSTCDVASSLGLDGWVRNLSDGRVEAVFEGPAAEVARAVAWCRRGPTGAWVEDVETRPEDLTGESGFRARPSASAFEVSP